MTTFDVHVAEQYHDRILFESQYVFRESRKAERVQKLGGKHGAAIDITNCVHTCKFVHIAGHPLNHFPIHFVDYFIGSSKEYP
jgi:hypothetical protein